jgi:hypothetical protein
MTRRRLSEEYNAQLADRIVDQARRMESNGTFVSSLRMTTPAPSLIAAGNISQLGAAQARLSDTLLVQGSKLSRVQPMKTR